MTAETPQTLFDLTRTWNVVNTPVRADQLKKNLEYSGLTSRQATWLEFLVGGKHYAWKQIEHPHPTIKTLIYLGFTEQKYEDYNPLRAEVAVKVLRKQKGNNIEAYQLHLTNIRRDSLNKKRVVETVYNLQTNNLGSVCVGTGLDEIVSGRLRDTLAREFTLNSMNPEVKPIVTKTMLSTIFRAEGNLAMIRASAYKSLEINDLSFTPSVEAFGYSCKRVEEKVIFTAPGDNNPWEIKVSGSIS